MAPPPFMPTGPRDHIPRAQIIQKMPPLLNTKGHGELNPGAECREGDAQEEHFNRRDLLQYYILDQVLPSPRGNNRELLLRRLECRYILNLNAKGEGGWNTEEELKVHLGE